MTDTLTLVSHTHWDREWYQPFQEYRIRLVQLVDRLLDLLGRDPDYRYFTLDGQTVLLEDYLRIRPEREAQIRAYVQAGRVLVGPWYILPDEFLVGPEATIRNLMLGDRLARDFGARMDVGYVPDSFGHISQLPQILRGFGLDSAVIWRGVGERPNEFRWAAPDGSQVLAIHLRQGYGDAAHLPPDADGFTDHLGRLAAEHRQHAATSYLLAMNGTDHLEPLPQLSRLLAAAAARLPDLELRHGTLPQHVAAVRAARPTLPLVQGELRSPARAHLLPGVFSARIWIKQRNAHCETLLEQWAEPFSALAALYGLPTPTRDLHSFVWQAWRYLLLNHPHDSICGCSVDAVHKEMDVRFDWVEQIGEEVTRQSLEALAAAVDTAALAGAPVVVFNPVAGPRTDLVSAQLHLPPDAEAVEVLDARGRVLPAEVVRPPAVETTSIELDRDLLRLAWTESDAGTLNGEGIQALAMSVAGDTAVLDVTIAPRPPVVEVLERAQAEVAALLDRPEIERFQVRLHHRGQAEVRFVAPDLPGHGYQAFAVRALPAAAPSVAATTRLENEFFTVTADPGDGTLTLVDKATGTTFAGLNRFVDGGDRGDEYNYCPPEDDRLVSAPVEPPAIRLVEAGPTRQTMEIALLYRVPAGLAPDRCARGDDLVPLPIVTRASLSPGVPRLDVETTVDNHARDHRLRALFPTPIRAAVAHVEGHFDVLARPLTLPPAGDDWPEQPVPTQHQRTFVDVSDGQAGLLLADRGLPEVEALPADPGLALALTLLRCVGWLSRDDMHCRRGHAGPGLPTPGAQCPGTHTFHYALVPHRGGWQEAYAQAHAFNAPLRAVAPVPYSGAPPRPGPAPGLGSLPVNASFLHGEPSDFVLTAVKRAHDGPGLIVRGFNIDDEPRDVTLRIGFPFRRVTRVNLNEQGDGEVARVGDEVRFAARPKEIVTLRFET
ncbi:MAG: alpha-mannosidase [Anaerolineae bacterium]